MRIITFSVLVLFVASACCETANLKGVTFLEFTIRQCTNSNESYSCLSEQAARAVEHAMDTNIPLLDGMSFVRNNETVSNRQGRLIGFDRLGMAVKNFLRTHSIALELGGARRLDKEAKAGDEGGGGLGFGGFGGGGGGGGFNRKAIKKEQKYVNYAFMVLLGIFGLTGPLVMKVLALMAAKALLAAKAALIIVGSVALKKLFEKDHPHEPAIKVHTVNHEEDDHDRMSKYGYTGFGYDYSKNYPYSNYYDEFYTKNNVDSDIKNV